jgi:hypothetical protein
MCLSEGDRTRFSKALDKFSEVSKIADVSKIASGKSRGLQRMAEKFNAFREAYRAQLAELTSTISSVTSGPMPE